MRKEVIVLVGLKGAGKTHLGSLWENCCGVRFLRVERLWLSLLPGEDGWAEVEKAIHRILECEERVVIESLGGSDGFNRLIAALSSRYRTLFVRVRASIETCAKRVKNRDSKEHLAVSDEQVDSYNQRAARVELPWHMEICNEPFIDDNAALELLKKLLPGVTSKPLQSPYEELNNVMWRSLTGAHAHFSMGLGQARRYGKGFSSLVGFSDPDNPDFDSLNHLAQPGESFYCLQWTGSPPSGWTIEKEATVIKMVWTAGMPDCSDTEALVPLQPIHAQQALDLAELTEPGPFALRTPELGEYLGYFEGNRLVAMAGERMAVRCYREISGICTHPDFRGRGLANKLTRRLVRNAFLRGETSFLHVMEENLIARRLYSKLGFNEVRKDILRVIRKAQIS